MKMSASHVTLRTAIGTVFAIVGDTGHSSGAEGSLALLQRLGFKVKNGKSADEEITDIVVRSFAKSNPSKQFFFKQADLDAAAGAAEAMNLGKPSCPDVCCSAWLGLGRPTA